MLPYAETYDLIEELMDHYQPSFCTDTAFVDPNWNEPDLVEQRKSYKHDLLMIHVNIKSIQNKFDELKLLNRGLKSQVMTLSEAKINSSYKSDQFRLQGHQIYRKDRKKGGGELNAYISSTIASKTVKTPTFKHIEVLAIEMKINNKDLLLIGAYRPPKVTGKDYYLSLEGELKSLFMWAEMQKQTLLLMGDLNLNRLDTNKRQGKILKDLEDGFGLECLITNPTRITNLSSTLIDVILTKRPDIFTKAGTYNPEIGDHCLTYGLTNKKVTRYKLKTILCRNLKTIDFELLTDDLSKAPWHVGEIFTEIDDRIDYWNGLMN